jgi:hypothetical protein
MFDNNIWNIWSVTAYSNPHAFIPLKSIIKMSKLPCMKKKTPHKRTCCGCTGQRCDTSECHMSCHACHNEHVINVKMCRIFHITINEDALAGDGSRSFHWNPFQPHCILIFFTCAHSVMTHWFATPKSQTTAGVFDINDFNHDINAISVSGFGNIKTISASVFVRVSLH